MAGRHQRRQHPGEGLARRLVDIGAEQFIELIDDDQKIGPDRAVIASLALACSATCSSAHATDAASPAPSAVARRCAVLCGLLASSGSAISRPSSSAGMSFGPANRHWASAATGSPLVSPGRIMATRQTSTAPTTPGVVSLGDNPARASEDLPEPLEPISSRKGVPRWPGVLERVDRAGRCRRRARRTPARAWRRTRQARGTASPWWRSARPPRRL